MNNLQFNEWLENRDPELYSEIDWRGLAEKGVAGARRGWDGMGDKARSAAKKAALGGAIGMTALGVGNHMLGPSDVDLVQKHFPNIAVQKLSQEELESYVAMAKTANAADRAEQAVDGANKFQYQQHNKQSPEDGFRNDVPDTHYQSPSFRK